MNQDDIYDHLINHDACANTRAFVLTAVRDFIETNSTPYEYAGYRYYYGENITSPLKANNSHVREMYLKRSPIMYSSSNCSIFLLSGTRKVLTLRYANDFFFKEIKDKKVAHTMSEMFARLGLVETRHRIAYRNVVSLKIPSIAP